MNKEKIRKDLNYDIYKPRIRRFLKGNYKQSIGFIFLWRDSPQGYGFWSDLSYDLGMNRTEPRNFDEALTFLRWLTTDTVDNGE